MTLQEQFDQLQIDTDETRVQIDVASDKGLPDELSRLHVALSNQLVSVGELFGQAHTAYAQSFNHFIDDSKIDGAKQMSSAEAERRADAETGCLHESILRYLNDGNNVILTVNNRLKILAKQWDQS